MSIPETKEALRPPSGKSADESTLGQSTVPSMMEKTEPPMSEHPAAHTDESHISAENENAEPDVNMKEKSSNSVEGAAQAEIASGSDDEDGYEYPKGIKLTFITIALCLSVFCMALDNTIIATAIPRITDQFKALDDVGWYGSSYLLTTCAFQLLFGKLYTFYSIKWVYMAALGIFELGSLICGAAPNSEALIVGRAIAGVGSAGIFSGAILIVAHTVSLQQRPTYTGLIGAMYGIASVAGPLMGGAFTDRLTWRWCFYINLPFGAVTAFFIIFFFTTPRRGAKAAKMTFMEQLQHFDLLGTAFFLPAIISLLLALTWGGTKFEWKDGRIIGLFVVFGVLIMAFIATQIWMGEKATVPPRIFLNRSVWGSAWFGAFIGAAFFIFVFYLPIWFQAIKGASAVKSGIMNLPMILGLVIFSIISGGMVSYFGYYTPFMIACPIFMAIGAGMISTFTPETGHAAWIGYQVLFGLGMGLGMQQTLIAVQAALPLADVPTGTAVMMFSQTLGGALFISVAQNIFQNQLVKNLASAVPDVDPLIVLRTGATELKSAILAVNPAALPRVLLAYNGAITNCFYVSVAMSALSIFGALFVEWKSVKGQPMPAGAV